MGPAGIGGGPVTAPDLAALLADWRARTGAIGAAGQAFDADGVVWSGAVGLADREAGIPMSAVATLLNVASVAKVATALAFLTLVEDGRIGLDDDVGPALGFAVRNPRFPADPITARLLLCHCSSLVDGPAVLAGYAPGDPADPLDDWLRRYVAEPAHFSGAQPGVAHRYANAGYGLLGLLAGALAGEDFRAFTRRALLAPLGLDGSGWLLADIDRRALARTYARPDELAPELRHLLAPDPSADGWRPLVPYGFPTYPDGSLRTTASGIAQLGRLVLGDGTVDGTTLLASGTVGAMRCLPPTGGGAYGLGLRRFAPGIWGHLGSDPGVSTGLWLDLATRRGVALVSNGATWDLDPAAVLAAGGRSG